MSLRDKVAALECQVCGLRAEYPEATLYDLHVEARESGGNGRLNAAKDALLAVCPNCPKEDDFCIHPWEGS